MQMKLPPAPSGIHPASCNLGIMQVEILLKADDETNMSLVPWSTM